MGITPVSSRFGTLYYRQPRPTDTVKFHTALDAARGENIPISTHTVNGQVTVDVPYKDERKVRRAMARAGFPNIPWYRWLLGT